MCTESSGGIALEHISDMFCCLKLLCLDHLAFYVCSYTLPTGHYFKIAPSLHSMIIHTTYNYYSKKIGMNNF